MDVLKMFFHAACFLLLGAGAILAQGVDKPLGDLYVSAIKKASGQSLEVYSKFVLPPSTDHVIELTISVSEPGRDERSHILAGISKDGLYQGPEVKAAGNLGGPLDRMASLDITWKAPGIGYCRIYTVRVKGVDANGETRSQSKKLNIGARHGSFCTRQREPPVEIEIVKPQSSPRTEPDQDLSDKSQEAQSEAEGPQAAPMSGPDQYLSDKSQEAQSHPEVSNEERTDQSHPETPDKESYDSSGHELLLENNEHPGYPETPDKEGDNPSSEGPLPENNEHPSHPETPDKESYDSSGHELLPKNNEHPSYPEVPKNIKSAFPDITPEQQQQILDKINSIDKNTYDLSYIYQERIYIATMKDTKFELPKMNELCKSAGGYLVEFDSPEEEWFVRDFLKSLGSYRYFTGANDVDSEGNFVYYNSKKPVTNVVWQQGEPNNGGGNENCVELLKRGLNDKNCSKKRGYICEIPLVDEPALEKSYLLDTLET